MRTVLAAAIAGLFANVALAQSGPLETWIRAHYADPSRVSLQTVIHDAEQAGIVHDALQLQALKDALRSLRGKARGGKIEFQQVDQPAPNPLPELGLDSLVEHEFNDSWQYADVMTGTVVAGDCTTIDDVDSWQFTSNGGFYTIAVQAAGLNPIADSTLVVRNQKGDVVATNDNSAVSFLSELSVFLPAGTYYAEVSSWSGANGGTYNLAVQRDDVNVVNLGAAGASGTTRAANGGVAHDVFSMNVPEGHLNLAVNSLGDDTQLTVQRADGVIVFTNDDSSIAGIDAAADIDLPGGTYYVYVNDIGGLAGVNFSVSYAETPGALTDVVTNGSLEREIVGDESMLLAKIDLSAGAGMVDMRTLDGTTTPVFDTVMALLDRDLDFLCDSDDDNAANPARGFYSRIRVSLPAGVYYAAVLPFPGQVGSYTLQTSTGAFAATGAIAYGPTPSPTLISGGGVVNTYSLENLTQVSAKMTGSDFWFSMIGADGELCSCQRGAPFNPQAGEIPAGGAYVLVYDRYDYSGPLDIAITPALHFDGAVVQTFAKEGDIVVQLAEFGLVPGPALNFGIGDRGFLLLPYTEFMCTMDVQIGNADGINSWWTPTVFPYQVMIQSVDLHIGTTWNPPAIATWRNMLHL